MRFDWCCRKGFMFVNVPLKIDCQMWEKIMTGNGQMEYFNLNLELSPAIKIYLTSKSTTYFYVMVGFGSRLHVHVTSLIISCFTFPLFPFFLNFELASVEMQFHAIFILCMDSAVIKLAKKLCAWTKNVITKNR